MNNFKYCLLCLATDVKMFIMNTSILTVYSRLLQLSLFKHEPYICYECAALLLKFDKFYAKCHRTHAILKALMSCDPKIIEATIRKMDTSKFNLESKLTLSDPVVQLQLSGYFDNEQKELALSEIKVESEEQNQDKQEKETNEEVYQNEQISESKLNIEVHKDEKTSESETYKEVYQDEQINNINKEINQDVQICINETVKSHDSECIDIESMEYLSDSSTINDFFSQKSAEKSKKIIEINEMTLEYDIIDADTSCRDFNVIPLVKQKISPKITIKDGIINCGNAGAISLHVTKQKHVEAKEQKNVPNFVEKYKDYITRVEMTPEEAREDVLLRKQSANYIQGFYKCDLCCRGFKVKSTFDNHMKKHSSAWALECEYCNLRFSTKATIDRHKMNNHTYKYICKVCSFVCYSSAHAISHTNLHKDEKQYTCEECDASFNVAHSLYVHRRRIHNTDAGEWVCDICGRVFTSERGIFTHKNKAHQQETNEEKGPKCEECSVQFATETAWKRHLVLSTKHGVGNGCEICGETFPVVSALKSHYNESHAPKQKRCYFMDHKSQHGGDRPHKCEECGKAYASMMTLRQHRIASHRPSRYECDVCQRRFARKHALQIHVQRHFGIKFYKCHLCVKTFVHQREVRSHVERMHRIVPWPKQKNKPKPNSGKPVPKRNPNPKRKPKPGKAAVS